MTDLQFHPSCGHTISLDNETIDLPTNASDADSDSSYSNSDFSTLLDENQFREACRICRFLFEGFFLFIQAKYGNEAAKSIHGSGLSFFISPGHVRGFEIYPMRRGKDFMIWPHLRLFFYRVDGKSETIG